MYTNQKIVGDSNLKMINEPYLENEKKDENEKIKEKRKKIIIKKNSDGRNNNKM